MKKIVGSALAVLLAFAALREFPIGETILPSLSGADEVRINLPRYIVPREIVFEGWPLPGGDFGMWSDPHARASIAQRGFLINHSGESVDFYYGAFDVNYRFEFDLRSHYLVVVKGGKSSKISFDGANLVPLARDVAPVFVGAVADKAVFFLGAMASDRIDSSAETGVALALVKLPFEDSAGQIVDDRTSQRWTEIVSLLKNNHNTDSYQASFCRSRWRPTLEFWERTLGRTCS